MADDAGHVARMLDRFQAPTPDPVQVRGELHAYLVQRGRQLAQDMDLGQVQDDDLAELGRLDAIAQHPTLDPGLATTLELAMAQRQGETTDQAIARLGCVGCYIGGPSTRHRPCEHAVSKAQDQAPDQGRDRGQGRATPTPARDQALDQGRPSPEASLGRRSEVSELVDSSDRTRGRVAQQRAQSPGTHVRNFLDEMFDRDEES